MSESAPRFNPLAADRDFFFPRVVPLMGFKVERARRQDRALLTRLLAAPGRFVFTVDVGRMMPTTAQDHLRRIRAAWRRRAY